MRISDWSSDVCSSDLDLAGWHLSDITRNALEDLLHERAKDVAASTLGRDRTAINSLLAYAVKRGLLTENPLAGVDHVEIDDDASERVRWLSADEQARFMAALAARELSAREARQLTLAQTTATHRHLPALADHGFYVYPP